MSIGMERLPSPTPHIIAEKDGAIGWLTFSRPARHNAMSLDMWLAVPEVLHSFSGDPEVRVIVLRGAGENAFVAGADISQFAENRADAEQAARYDAINNAAFTAIRDAGKPTIAMIHGFCVGGGVAIAISCDLRMAAEGSTFAVTAARLGLAYPAEATRLLLETVGPACAKELFFTGRHFDHAEAFAMGLVNRTFPSINLEREVREICTQIAENAPLSMAIAKATINAMMLYPDTHDREQIDSLTRTCYESFDYREGRTAFMEKRKPQFRGE
jgi:enoyl-CoA hydratase/carnithine racemase